MFEEKYGKTCSFIFYSIFASLRCYLWHSYILSHFTSLLFMVFSDQIHGENQQLEAASGAVFWVRHCCAPLTMCILMTQELSTPWLNLFTLCRVLVLCKTLICEICEVCCVSKKNVVETQNCFTILMMWNFHPMLFWCIVVIWCNRWAPKKIQVICPLHLPYWLCWIQEKWIMTGERMTWAVFAMKIPHPRLCKQREPLTQKFSRPWMAEHVEVAGIVLYIIYILIYIYIYRYIYICICWYNIYMLI